MSFSAHVVIFERAAVVFVAAKILIDKARFAEPYIIVLIIIIIIIIILNTHAATKIVWFF